MVELTNLFTPDAVLPAVKATSKKQLLQELSNRAAEVYNLDAREVFDAVTERERLGPTGMGRGVAVPHARLDSVDEIVGVFARLEKGVDFDAVDDEPVDLVCLLLAPAEAGADHLRALAKVSRILRDEARCSKLRATRDTGALFAILTEDVSTRAA